MKLEMIHACYVRFSLHSSQVAHKAGAYPSFCSMEKLGIFLLHPEWDASPLHGYPPAVNLQLSALTVRPLQLLLVMWIFDYTLYIHFYLPNFSGLDQAEYFCLNARLLKDDCPISQGV